MSEFNKDSQKQGTDIHYNKAGQAVNTESNTTAVKDQSSPTGDDTSEKKSTLNKAEEDNKKQTHSSHSGTKHAKLGGKKHSFVHPENIDDAQKHEQKVKCDCGESVPVSQINQEDVNVAVKGQQSQNVDGSKGQTTVVIDESRPKGQQEAKITVDNSTNPATVIDNGIKSSENLYQHDSAVDEAINRKVVTTKTVSSSVNNPEINEANSNIPIDLEAGKHNPGKKSKKD